MSRNDIADYLGLTIETVCRTLSAFKRGGIIAIPIPTPLL
jgi:CRP-like cAMP-binding protein